MKIYANTLAAIALVGLSLPTVPAVLANEEEDYEREEATYIELMDSYLEVSERFVNLAASPDASVYFAIEGMVEIYEERGEGRAAIPHLQQILEQYGDSRTIRTLIRFKLRDLYRDTQQSELALKELEAIISENR